MIDQIKSVKKQASTITNVHPGIISITRKTKQLLIKAIWALGVFAGVADACEAIGKNPLNVFAQPPEQLCGRHRHGTAVFGAGRHRPVGGPRR